MTELIGSVNPDINWTMFDKLTQSPVLLQLILKVPNYEEKYANVGVPVKVYRS